jgi:hypothetical protein
MALARIIAARAIDIQAEELATPVSWMRIRRFSPEKENRYSPQRLQMSGQSVLSKKCLETVPVRGMIGRVVRTTHGRAG